MNQLLGRKKISIGVSFCHITPTEFTDEIVKYHDSIGEIYFSPCESINYQTRNFIYDKNKSIENKMEELSYVLNKAKEYNICLNMVLNTNMINRSEVIDITEKYLNSFKISSITTFTKHALLLQHIFPEINYSCTYNQGLNTIDKINNLIDQNIFTSIVLGSNFLRSIDIFSYVHKKGLKVKLLVNNGCAHNCTNFCKDSTYCEDNFNKLLFNSDINKIYAEQSLFPEELDYYNDDDIIYYKLSSRPISKKELDDLLYSYISKKTIELINSDKNNYHLWGRLFYFTPYYDQLDYEKIVDYKKEIWKSAITLP